MRYLLSRVLLISGFVGRMRGGQGTVGLRAGSFFRYAVIWGVMLSSASCLTSRSGTFYVEGPDQRLYHKVRTSSLTCQLPIRDDQGESYDGKLLLVYENTESKGYYVEIQQKGLTYHLFLDSMCSVESVSFGTGPIY